MTSVVKWGCHRIISYSSENAMAIAKSLQDGTVDGVSIASYEGFSDASLDCLRSLKGLKILVVHGLPKLPLDALQDLPELEELALGETKHTLDLASLPSLRRLSVNWHKKIFKDEYASNINSLHLWKYKSTQGDLSDFSGFSNLVEFELVQSNIKSLNGISRFRKLEKIELSHLTHLETLGVLDLPDLRSFVAADCKKISDHEQLSACTSLRELKLNRCGEIETIHFIDSLTKLDSFRFIGTDVLDGDLSPLRRLSDVFFSEKKHFTHRVNSFHQKPIEI